MVGHPAVGGSGPRGAAFLDAGPRRGDDQLRHPSRRRRGKPKTGTPPGPPLPPSPPRTAQGAQGGGRGGREERPAPRVEHQRSAGGLIVRNSRILLISTQEARRWQLPKGHIEAGETPEQTAIREVREETGVTGRIVAPLPAIDYWFFDRGARIHKRVDYFLLEYVSGDPADFDAREVSGTGWFSWEAGIARLTFDNERRVAVKARDLLEADGGSASTARDDQR